MVIKGEILPTNILSLSSVIHNAVIPGLTRNPEIFRFEKGQPTPAPLPRGDFQNNYEQNICIPICIGSTAVIK